MKVTITVSPNFYFDDINFIKSLVNSHGWSFDTNDVTEIDCSASEIVSLKGIEIFSNLRKLSCNANQISEMDLSSLKYLSFTRAAGFNIRVDEEMYNKFLQSDIEELNKQYERFLSLNNN